MNLRDDSHLIDRVGKKRRKRLMMSAELIEVLDGAVGHGEASSYVERAVWNQLVEDYGREQVKESAQSAQEDIESNERLAEPKPITLDA